MMNSRHRRGVARAGATLGMLISLGLIFGSVYIRSQIRERRRAGPTADATQWAGPLPATAPQAKAPVPAPIPPKPLEGKLNLPAPGPKLPPPPAYQLVAIDLPVGTVVSQLAFNPTGESLTVGTNSGTAFWYAAGTGKQTAASDRQRLTGELSGCAVTSDGDLLAFAKHGGLLTLVSRDKENDTILEPERPGGLTQWGVAFSPDGRRLCTTHGLRVVHIWDVPGRKKLKELKGADGHDGAAAFSPDGELLAFADKEIVLRETTGYKAVGRLPVGDPGVVRRLAFSSDGRMLAGTTDRSVLLWSLNRADGRVTSDAPSIRHESGQVTGTTFGPTGQLISATDDGRVRVIDPASMKTLAEVKLPGVQGQVCLAVARNPDRLAVGCGRRVVIIDLDKIGADEPKE